jgi:malonyl-CoA decarboxylase
VLDAVANFHFSNGATVDRINWMADASPAGRERAFGLMANYLYDNDRIAERAEEYAAHGLVPASSAVRDLVAR